MYLLFLMKHYLPVSSYVLFTLLCCVLPHFNQFRENLPSLKVKCGMQTSCNQCLLKIMLNVSIQLDSVHYRDLQLVGNPTKNVTKRSPVTGLKTSMAVGAVEKTGCF